MRKGTLPDGFDIRQKAYRDFKADSDHVKLRRSERSDNLRLILNGEEHEISRVASAFPLSSSLDTVAFFDSDGEEIGVMKNPRALDDPSQELLQEELDKSYFMPRILEIKEMEENLGVESWQVVTDKGERTFEVRDPRRNVRKIADDRVIIKDVDGNRYEVRDWTQLDRNSIRLLMRHL